MAERYHILTTIAKDLTVVRAPPHSNLDLVKIRANAAGDAKLCREQTIRSYEGRFPYGQIVERLARLSQGGSWSNWAQDCRPY